MFDVGSAAGMVSDDPPGWTVADEAALDWARIEQELRTGEEDRTWGNTEPSGLFAWELDTDTGDPGGLSDAQLVDAIVGFERVAGWAQARQAGLLAEFARRRPGG
ncbi:MAG: hypothetical protein ACRDXB_09805 [Actinomycetes bacterium]